MVIDEPITELVDRTLLRPSAKWQPMAAKGGRNPKFKLRLSKLGC
jgi:hypothetical protein